MTVSVIIPAYNEEKNIVKCLESLANQTVKPDEIIVIDNNCSDRTAEIAEKFGAKVVVEKKQGMAYARNAGFNCAKCEILVKTDSDTILPPDWISRIKENFKDPNLGGLSGPASYFKTPLKSKISSSIAFDVFYVIGLILGHPAMFGPNTALRKSLWEKIKKEVCLSDKDVHEDIDLSIHLAPFAKIKFDKKLIVRTTRGRWKKILTEYIVRLTKMIASHKVDSYSSLA